MKKLTDQEIDSIFKDAAEGYTPPFEMTAWEAMNAKLNQAGKASFLVRYRWILISMIGLMIFSGGVWLGTNIGKETEIASTVATTGNKVSTYADTNENAIDKNHPTENSKSKSNSISEEINERENVNQKANRTEDQQQSTSIQENIKIPLNSNDDKTSLLRRDTHGEIDNAGNSKVESGNDSSGDLLASNLNDQKTKVSTEDSVLEIKLTQIDTTGLQQKAADKKVVLPSSHGIFLRVLASPDFSAVNFSSSSAPGNNYAFLVEYQLANRWLLATGAIWSLKKYKSTNETSYGVNAADNLQGECKIIDIPLNVYYHFKPQLKTSFYAGIGLSSYLMLQEDYTYTVVTSHGNYPYSTNVSGKNKEWFKMLNLSAGVQYQLSPRWHIQAEPFLKVPLKRVGEGKILLSSMGLFVGIKYKIN